MGLSGGGGQDAVQDGLTELLRQGVIRWAERFIDPGPQVFVSKQIPAQQSDQIRKGPTQTAFKLEEFDQKHGDECCPNLDVHGIGRDADEGFDTQILFDGFEKQFNLPALAVDFGNRFGSQVETVGDQFHFLLLIFQPDHYPTVGPGDPTSRLKQIELPYLVGSDDAVSRYWTLLHGIKIGVLLQPADKSHSLGGPAFIELVIRVAAIDHHD